MPSTCDVYMLAFLFVYFFFNDPATTEIYTLSLHDALPILTATSGASAAARDVTASIASGPSCRVVAASRSEEHTSELQSRQYLVCRLLLEKKKNKKINRDNTTYGIYHALYESQPESDAYYL